MRKAIHQLQEAGVEPDVWKIEGLDRRGDCERIVAAARRDGRSNVGCIVQLAGAGIPVVHTAELLDWAAGGPAPT